jgi:hypothetical protein
MNSTWSELGPARNQALISSRTGPSAFSVEHGTWLGNAWHTTGSNCPVVGRLNQCRSSSSERMSSSSWSAIEISWFASRVLMVFPISATLL